jgi:hypothetical protein
VNGCSFTGQEIHQIIKVSVITLHPIPTARIEGIEQSSEIWKVFQSIKRKFMTLK